MAEYTLIFSNLKATGVPDADARGGSDPYCRITLLNTKDGSIETGRTQPIFNTSNPEWPHNVQLTLRNGMDSPLGISGMASDMVANGISVGVCVYDKDMTTSDDVIGRAVVDLAPGQDINKQIERTVTLSDPQGKFKSFDFSFSWMLSDEVPDPATLTFSNVKAKGVGKRGKQDPYIRFRLLECGDLSEHGRLSTKVNETNPDWGDETVALSLPHGQSRPPLVRIFLWDDDMEDDDDGLATNDVRLPPAEGGAGKVETTLVGIGKKNKNVDISFSFKIECDLGEDVDDDEGGEMDFDEQY